MKYEKDKKFERGEGGGGEGYSYKYDNKMACFM